MENATKIVDHSIDLKFKDTSNREYYTLIYSWGLHLKIENRNWAKNAKFFKFIFLQKFQRLIYVFQVERKIVNQLAAAHERGLIQAKSAVHLVVEHHKDDKELKANIKMKVEGNSSGDSRDISIDDVIDDQRPIFF